MSPIGASQFNSPVNARIAFAGSGSEPHLGLDLGNTNTNDISNVGISPDVPFRQDNPQFSENINIKQPPNSNKNGY